MILRVARSAAAGTILATLALLAMLAFRPVSTEIALDGYVLVLGGIVLLALIGVVTETDPDARRSPYDQALEPPAEEGERPPELARVERELALAVSSAFYEHYRLRPLLRDIAAQRVESRFAADLSSERSDVRAALPEEAWALLDPDRNPPRDRHARGIRIESLREVVDALEKI